VHNSDDDAVMQSSQVRKMICINKYAATIFNNNNTYKRRRGWSPVQMLLNMPDNCRLRSKASIQQHVGSDRVTVNAYARHPSSHSGKHQPILSSPTTDETQQKRDNNIPPILIRVFNRDSMRNPCSHNNRRCSANRHCHGYHIYL
jgi:hypothetical protein